MQQYLQPWQRQQRERLMEKLRPLVGQGHDCGGEARCDCAAKLEELVSFVEYEIGYAIRRVCDEH